MQNKYVPGVCNIGEADILKRRRIGWTWLAATMIIFFILIIPGVPRSWRLVLLFTSAISATGFLQARMHFCAYFAVLGIFNFGEAGKFDSVQQAEFRAMDRRKALQIISYSVLIGIAVALGALFLPV